jgi:Domain of unknown function (DUF4279)
MACEAVTRSVDDGMTEPNEQYAYFTITGDFDPAEISQQAGMTPTEQWRTGDINPRTKLERKFSRWSLYSRLEKTASLEAHISDVIDQMKAHASNFVALSTTYGGVMQLVAYFKRDYPGLHFGATLVESLSAFSLSVDFDFYYLYSDRREDSE